MSPSTLHFNGTMEDAALHTAGGRDPQEPCLVHAIGTTGGRGLAAAEPLSEADARFKWQHPQWALEEWGEFVRTVGVRPVNILEPPEIVEGLRRGEEASVAAILSNMSIPCIDGDPARPRRAGRFDSALPESAQLIRGLMDQQAHHLRSALFAGRQLQHAWREAQREMLLRPQEAGILAIGDGHALLEVKKSNAILRQQVLNLQEALRADQERCRRGEDRIRQLEAELRKAGER